MNSAAIQPALEPPRQFIPETETPPRDYNLDIVRSIRMRPVLTAAVAIFVFLCIIIFALSRRPYYETQALIYVQPMQSKLVTDTTQGTYDSSRYEAYVAQQLQTIVRTDILAEALKKPATRLWRFPHEPDQAAIARLQSTLKVERVQNSYELSVNLAGSNPVAIANVVNAVTNAYIHGERDDELAQTDQQLQILQDELQRVSAELLSDRREQADLSVTLGVADTTGDTGNPYDSQLNDLRSELSKAISAHDVAAAQLSSVSSSGTGTSDSLRAAADETAATDPGLSMLKQTIGQRRSILTSQMSGLTPKNPIYKQDQDELDRLQASLTQMESDVRANAGQQLQQKLQLEANRTADIVARLSNQLQRKTAIATGATPQLQHAADVTADITRLQARYNQVDAAINSIQLERDTSGLVHILVPAVPPLSAKTSTKRLIYALSLPFALFMGLFAAVAARRLDPRIYTSKDLTRVLHFDPMAILPSAADVAPPVRDEFMLRVVAGLDQAHRIDGVRTFVFTSTSPKSSITEFVTAVTREMESLGYSVSRFKSSDLRRAAAASRSNAQLPLLELPITKAEPIRSENFVIRNLETLKQTKDLLFIEAPPLLFSASSEFAARLSDVVVLVAESGLTTRTELSSSLALAQRLHVQGVATVLDDVSLRHASPEFLAAVRSVEQRTGEDEPTPTPQAT